MSRITYDALGGDEPRAGDVLRTKRGCTWLVEASRQVRSRVSASRWALQVRPVVELPTGARVLSLVWYPRGQARIRYVNGRRSK